MQYPETQRLVHIPSMQPGELKRWKYSRITVPIHATQGWYPQTTEDIQAILQVAHFSNGKGDPVSVTTTAAGLAFGAQALPPDDPRTAHRWVMSTKDLPKQVVVHPQTEEEYQKHIVRITASAGLSFRELHQCMDTEKHMHMPFNVPTADRITLGGALAANTLSRSSSLHGFFLDHVHAFTLVTPQGIFRCSPHAADPLARDLFYAFPGSQGMFGCVTDLELDVQQFPANRIIHTNVLDATGNLEKFANQITAHTRYNAAQVLNGKDPYWNKGVYAAFGGNPATRGRGYIYGSREDGTKKHYGGFPLYADNLRNDVRAQILGHACPRIPQEAMRWIFTKDKSFHDPLYSFTYFQRSHPEARDNPGLLGKLFNHTLPVTQQTWIMQPEHLCSFMEYMKQLLRTKRFKPVTTLIELQDILLLPQSSAWMSPCHGARESVAYTISVASDTAGPQSHLIQEFLSRVSTYAFEHWHAKVHLLKETYCPDELLREMYAPQLKRANEVREKVDPHHSIRSSLSDRLLGNGGSAGNRTQDQ
ncbi:hypothetical protein COU77_02565 [Candidatus Peregrinibacteria bacterium CG10_big_fil_rev_8_21_14_0_10_49_16]|nr:MAG: hypothetical protein COW95_04710 [Candidatus Peregrinibacteria bacterium CG22_combo_CG10-13_8_21_14_all_49_11]PIR51925.1 MAG: hypothetical protein COU77_02565 [Candidatus Peregrinibacteria bacterium CG10_big_fil_rev_8_21_14_0_10_49_16]